MSVCVTYRDSDLNLKGDVLEKQMLRAFPVLPHVSHSPKHLTSYVDIKNLVLEIVLLNICLQNYLERVKMCT